MGIIRRHDRRPEAPSLEIRVVSTPDDYYKVLAVRAAVFMGEMAQSYAQEFDGNDFCATHLLALVDGQPAGAMRIRYFGEFAKPERLGVLGAYRKRRIDGKAVAFELGKFAFDYCAKKGYRRVYGQAREELQRFWSRFAKARPIPGGELWFGPIKCVAMLGEVEPPPDAIGLNSDHLVLVRPEGHWDEPGIHELTQPAAAWAP